MQTELNHTVKSLFGKESLEDISRDDLLLMTKKYPYSSILHFLYTKKLQTPHDLRYPASVAKTALYFSNPHWLHHQLRSKTSVEALAEMEMAFEKNISTHNVNEERIEKIIDLEINENGFQPGKKIIEESIYIDANSIPEKEIESISIDNAIPVDFSYNGIEESEENVLLTDQDQPKTTEIDQELIFENPTHPFYEKTELSGLPGDFLSEPKEANLLIQESDKLESPLEIGEPQIIKDTPHLPIEEDVHISAETHLQASEPDALEIPFEPLYTSDYFASQGIRLREEDQQDQLGKKLKSFTEWLKSMKKVHPERSKEQMDEKTEAAIKSGAELSNDKADVLTETMAEVFIKQGLTQKAIDVYEKLSLLDPLKSATFAAKISELKAHLT